MWLDPATTAFQELLKSLLCLSFKISYGDHVFGKSSSPVRSFWPFWFSWWLEWESSRGTLLYSIIRRSSLLSIVSGAQWPLNKCHLIRFVFHICVCVLSHFGRVQLFATPWTVAHQAPLSWDSPGKNSGVGCCFLLQEIFLTQGSNPCLLRLLYCRWILLPLSHRGSYFTFIWPQNDSWEVSGASLGDQSTELDQSIFTGLQQNEEKF